jgi:alkyldihydroxyacetonephosphate synthase
MLELPPFPSSAAGPDLREVVLGSEGRLGVLTEATVRATRLPEQEAFHAVFFADLEHGHEAVREIMQARLPLSMVRLSTAVETQTTLALAGHEQLIGGLERLLSLRGAGDEKVMLLLGFSGRDALVKMARGEALDIASRHGGVHMGRTFGEEWHKSRFYTPYLRNSLWEVGYAVDTLETAVGWAELPAMIDDVQAALRGGLEDVGERVHAFTHLSHLYPFGSSIYTTYLFRLAVTGDREADARENLRRWQVLKGAASEAILARGGTITHQHGIGTDHLPYMAREKGVLGSRIIADLCCRFDPGGIMNPGKLIEGGDDVV